MTNYQLIYDFDEIGDLDFSTMLVYRDGKIPKEVKDAYEQQGGQIGSCSSPQDLGDLVGEAIPLEKLHEFEDLFQVSILTMPFASKPA
jgi:hypothetical protein